MLKVYDNKTAPIKVVGQDMPFDQILIEGLVLPASIGVFDFEHKTKQPVRIDIDLDIKPLSPEAEHETHNIVRYDHIVADIKAIIAGGHIELIEILAEQVADICLRFERAVQVRVAIAKLDIIDEADAVGVRITRRKS